MREIDRPTVPAHGHPQSDRLPGTLGANLDHRAKAAGDLPNPSSEPSNLLKGGLGREILDIDEIGGDDCDRPPRAVVAMDRNFAVTLD